MNWLVVFGIGVAAVCVLYFAFAAFVVVLGYLLGAAAVAGVLYAVVKGARG